MKLCQKEYHGRWTATEMGATQQCAYLVAILSAWCGSVYSVYRGTIECLLQPVNLENYRELTWELTGKPWWITPA